MNVMLVGLDRSLFNDRREAVGDAQVRFIRYGRYLSGLYAIVFTERRLGLKPCLLSDNVMACPTNSLSKYTFIVDALAVARKILGSRGIDLVSTQDPFATGLVGYLLKRRYGLPLNIQLFSSFFENEQWLREDSRNLFLHRLGKALVRRADTVRVESAIERDFLIRLGVKKERIYVVPLLFNFARFLNGDGGLVRRRILGSDENEKKMVLYVGRLSREKDVPTLLKAASVLSRGRTDMVFVVVGGGKEEAALKKLAAGLDLSNVHFAGVVPYEDLPHYYHACDVFVLSSLYEGIPTVLVEAALAGKPVVSTDTRNIADVLEDGLSGFVVRKGDPEGLAQKIGILLSDPALAARMGAAGRGLIQERYDPERICRDLITMWRATAGRN